MSDKPATEALSALHGHEPDEDVPDFLLGSLDMESMASDANIAKGKTMAKDYAMKCALIESMESRLKTLKEQ